MKKTLKNGIAQNINHLAEAICKTKNSKSSNQNSHKKHGKNTRKVRVFER